MRLMSQWCLLVREALNIKAVLSLRRWHHNVSPESILRFVKMGATSQGGVHRPSLLLTKHGILICHEKNLRRSYP